jgi:hypothetical protein
MIQTAMVISAAVVKASQAKEVSKRLIQGDGVTGVRQRTDQSWARIGGAK